MLRKLALAGLAAALIVTPVALAGADRKPDRRSSVRTLAIIGDIPYGAALIAEFPADIAQINADPRVSRVVHLGDIKDGSSRCDDTYFAARRADFDRFKDPLVYTPGDNEWTDCHRANNGGYLPTERLTKIRQLFFPVRGRTLGDSEKVDYQSRAYPENVMWDDDDVQYGVVHVVGSNDDQAPWFGDRKDAANVAQPETPSETALRSREYIGREAAALEWIDAIFDEAEDEDAPGVVLGMQADMWDPTAAQSAFAPIKAVIADRAARFGKPVLLLQGDSHLLKVDTPAGMPANLVRVVVQGSTNMPHEWLRLQVDPASARVFSCEDVVFGSGVVTPCPTPLAP
jgi:hypothetical protein